MEKSDWKELGATGVEAARVVSGLKKIGGASR
jgi:hypothetical protein